MPHEQSMSDEFRRGAAWTWALVHEICPEICDHKNWPVLKEVYEEGTATKGQVNGTTHPTNRELADQDHQ